MTRLPQFLCLVLAACTGLFVIAAVPAHAIQYMTPGFPGGGGTSEKETAVDKLKKKWEEQPEVVKEEVREQVDKAKDVAKEKVEGQAKKAGKKVWKKIEKLKKFGKYAKKAGEVLKRYKRVLGPVGQVLDAAEKGYKTGGKIHQRIVGPLMAAHFDRKDEEWQRQLQEDIARIRRNAQQRSSTVSDSPEPDTLEHYADQQLQEYMDALPPLNDSQEGYAEALEQYNEARRSEQPTPYEAPQEPYQEEVAVSNTQEDFSQPMQGQERVEAARRRAYERFKADCDSRGGRVEPDPYEQDLYHCYTEEDSPSNQNVDTLPMSQETYADTPGHGAATPARRAGDTFQDCGTCPQMVVVPAGSFMMGSPSHEEARRASEVPVHQVTIAQPFAVGVYEVTFAEWEACASGGGCGHRPDDEGWGRGQRPVIHVNWDDAQAYVRWLSQQTGESYRLLSEAEWEYAARAGTTTPFHFGESISPSQANYDGDYTYGGGGRGQDRQQTVPVGSFGPNPFGLHDVHGNVWEWVQDCWNENYNGAPSDGRAWEVGDCSRRVLRGGSWYYEPRVLRSANRFRNTADIRSFNYYGCRIARSLP